MLVHASAGPVCVRAPPGQPGRSDWARQVVPALRCQCLTSASKRCIWARVQVGRCRLHVYSGTATATLSQLLLVGYTLSRSSNAANPPRLKRFPLRLRPVPAHCRGHGLYQRFGLGLRGGTATVAGARCPVQGKHTSRVSRAVPTRRARQSGRSATGLCGSVATSLCPWRANKEAAAHFKRSGNQNVVRRSLESPSPLGCFASKRLGGGVGPPGVAWRSGGLRPRVTPGLATDATGHALSVRHEWRGPGGLTVEAKPPLGELFWRTSQTRTSTSRCSSAS